jgi:hypothetical protein
MGLEEQLDALNQNSPAPQTARPALCARLRPSLCPMWRRGRAGILCLGCIGKFRASMDAAEKAHKIARKIHDKLHDGAYCAPLPGAADTKPGLKQSDAWLKILGHTLTTPTLEQRRMRGEARRRR